jgi:hypothetical protein
MSTAFKSAAHVPGFSMSYGDFCAAVLAAVEWELHPTKTSRHTAPAKTPGQIAYEADLERQPNYDWGGKPRPTWETLGDGYTPSARDAMRASWEKTPAEHHAERVANQNRGR